MTAAVIGAALAAAAVLVLIAEAITKRIPPAERIGLDDLFPPREDEPR